MTLNQAVVHHHVEGEEKLWIKSIIIRIVFIFFPPAESRNFSLLTFIHCDMYKAPKVHDANSVRYNCFSPHFPQSKAIIVSAQKWKMREAIHWLSIVVHCSECPRLPEAIIDSSMKGECKMKRAVMYFSQAPTDKSFTALQMEFSPTFLDGAHVFRLELALSAHHLSQIP